MAKKAYLKGEEFVFTRVKGSSETDYRDGDVNINPTNLGLGNVTNTSDADKPVSTAQRKAIDDAYANSNKYTDQKIADLIGGASETMDTLKEVEQAIASSKSTEEALNKAIGTKANQTELDTHTGNDTIHITASERAKWNKNGGVTGVRGSAESDYKTGQATISPEDIGLGNVDNTADLDKTVYRANGLTIHNNLVGGSTTNGTVEFMPDALYSDSEYYPVCYDPQHRIMSYNKDADTSESIVNFVSADSATGDSTAPDVLTSGERHKSIFNKISILFKNVRWLLSKMGTTDISAIGNGTVTGALSTLNSNINYVTPILISKESIKIEPGSNYQYNMSQIINRNYLEIYFYSGYNGYRYNVCIPLGGINVSFQQNSTSNSYFATTYDKTNQVLIIRNNSSVASITIYRILSVYK